MIRRSPLALAALVATLLFQPCPSFAEPRTDAAERDRHRSPGIATSMIGTRIARGQLLVYPFAEWYADHDFEYKPTELGGSFDDDVRGGYSASEALLFVAYGLSDDLAVELEAAYITAELERAPDDPTDAPREFEESGVGDVEGQLRWRLQRETATRPELFTFVETVFPLQKGKRLIGTQDWEHKVGFGLTRGYRWGAVTARLAAEYSREERKVDPGEYALEFQRRLSPRWQLTTAIEGNQLDEVAFIAEAQWRLAPRATLKVNHGLGLTPNATDHAPELGLMFAF